MKNIDLAAKMSLTQQIFIQESFEEEKISKKQKNIYSSLVSYSFEKIAAVFNEVNAA